ncbi:hypothetical protein E2C01_088975 [Portunus trituberculatus]|uniref:MADF domain-containing protein n=1 Tax=Portunus trituberculatus TaxID=210409 RepID=A0A5B7JAR8_PORTR|nr:hypothetical protein [Portunus trituberculatus]
MKFAWTRESEELLLEQVRDHRIVWDPKHVDYHRFKLRQEIFSQIADTIREQFPELKQLNGGKLHCKITCNIQRMPVHVRGINSG